LQDDIENSRKLASEIVRQAKIDEHREETLRDKHSHLDFLSKEVLFHKQLLLALRSIQEVNICLDKAEGLIQERKILDGLRMLEGMHLRISAIMGLRLTVVDAWKVIAEVPVDKHTRAITLLDQRCFRLRESAHDSLMAICDRLIHVDPKAQSITINKNLPSM